MKLRKYQQGGPMPAEQAAPAPAQGGQDQMMAQLEQMAMEIIQSVGPEGAAMLAEMIMTILQQQAPVGQPQGQPVFAKGGKLIRRK
jgi:hypothetical protein